MYREFLHLFIPCSHHPNKAAENLIAADSGFTDAKCKAGQPSNLRSVGRELSTQMVRSTPLLPPIRVDRQPPIAYCP